MPVYAKTVTITNANEGYSLATLLSGTIASEASGRMVSYLKLTIDASDVYVVPATGAYSHTNGIPSDYGVQLNSVLEIHGGIPFIPLEEIILGSGTASRKVHVLAIV